MAVLAGVQCDVRATQALEGGRGEGVWWPTSLPRGHVLKPGTAPPPPSSQLVPGKEDMCVHTCGPAGAGLF